MSKSILITGGAASGKSRWAATYFSACDYVLYLNVSGRMDADTLNRIEYGNKLNSVEWDIETGADSLLADRVTDHKFVILDSLGSYASHVMNEMCPSASMLDEERKKKIERRIIDDITELRERVDENDGSMIIITLETGFSVTPENRSQAVFREILGNVNQRIANSSDEVYFSASGIQFKIK